MCSTTSPLDRPEGNTDNDDNEDIGERVVVLPIKVKAHSFKKSGVNDLADHLQFHTFLFRCGWMARNLHTAFDYIFNNERKDVACGKVLAGWTLVGSNGERHGGCPPKTNMNHKPDVFDLFVKNLFFPHKKHLRNDNVDKILCTFVLLNHDEFNRILQEEPKGKFHDWKSHPFNLKLLSALADSGK